VSQAGAVGLAGARPSHDVREEVRHREGGGAALESLVRAGVRRDCVGLSERFRSLATKIDTKFL